MVVHALPGSAVGDPFPGRKASDREYISFRDVWGFIARYFLTLAVFTILGLCAGAFYVSKTPSTFQATTRLVMDPEQGRVSWQDAATGTIIIETAEIASQVEIVKSETVAQTVIGKLGLTEDPELMESKSWQSVGRGAVVSFAEWATGKSFNEKPDRALTEAEIMRRTMASFLARVSVQRVGQSYVLEIGYVSGDPQKAAKVANTLARAYIQVGMNDRADMARSGAKWLETRLVEVGRQAREASMAAEEFRTKKNITVVGNQSTLDQQQLSEVSSQLLAARAATASETANLTGLLQAIADGTPDGHLGNPVFDSELQKLREEIRLAQTRLENLKSRYSVGNPAIVAAEAEIARLTAAVQSQLQRVEGVYRSNLQAAKTREQLAQDRLEALTKTTAAKNEAVAELSEIESRANTYRRIYEGVLQQLVGTVQTQSFPLGKARIVTAATAPLGKTWPKTSVILPFSAVIGMAFGLFVAILRQNLNHRASSSEHLRRELGISSLGHVPVYKPDKRFKVATNTSVPSSMAPLRSVLDMPYSPFSEALRSVKNSVDSIFPEHASMVVGITSVGPGEGKTTVSINLAQLYRNEGKSVLLVDGDFVSSRLSRVATIFPEDLSLERLSSADIETPTDDTAPHSAREGDTLIARKTVRPRQKNKPADQASGLAVPVFTASQIKERKLSHQHYGHLPALRNGIERLRNQYDVIIVDMSGFEDSADTRAICTYLDGIVVVLGRSNKMTIERLSDALATFGKSRIVLLGSISNRSNR